jgi:glycine/D-amino acid oxidase-like deaminating enzyme
MAAAAAAGDVVIVGAGLAGSLLALELRALGREVTLLHACQPGIESATAISYGAVPGWPLASTPLARAAAQAGRHWRRLQQSHGDLGWRPRPLRLQGGGAMAALAGLWPRACSQVDTAVLQALLPQRLAAAGVQSRIAPLQGLEPAGGHWRLVLEDGHPEQAATVVLAAGGRSRALWPHLPARLCCSWAAVLELLAFPARLGRPALWLPQRFSRLALEGRAAGLVEPAWVVDPGLVPHGDGALLGQLSLVRPQGMAAAALPPPEAEALLRAGLAAHPWGGHWAEQPGQLRQAPVAFTTAGPPLVGPVPQAEGLWVFSGFSAGFSQVPVLAPLLAAGLAAAPGPAQRARWRLQQLGVWPAGG